MKFKKRKAAAEKNLAAESQNLLRVQDILTELEKQIGPLQLQSQKAREYLNFKEELKKYEIGLFRMDYDSLQKEMDELRINTENTAKELEQAKAEKEQSKAQYDEIEASIAEFDHSIERKKEKVNNNKLLRTNFESEVRITKEKISSVTQGKEYYKERMDALEASRAEAEAELKGYQETSGEPVFQPRRPNSRLDKIRHMFQKIM